MHQIFGAQRSVSIFKLKKRGGPHDLEISMTGIKLGSNVLQISRSDGSFAAALAGIVGLSGRACAVVKTKAEAERFGRAAATAGVLLEIQIALPGALPYNQESFDVVVIKNAIGEMVVNDRVACLQQRAPSWGTLRGHREGDARRTWRAVLEADARPPVCRRRRSAGSTESRRLPRCPPSCRT